MCIRDRSYRIEVIDEGFTIKRDKPCIFDMSILNNLHNICTIIFLKLLYLNKMCIRDRFNKSAANEKANFVAETTVKHILTLLRV